MDSIKIVYISTIIKKKILGEISEKEQEVLNKWLEESPRHRELYEKYQSADFLSSINRPNDLHEAEAAYSRFKRKLNKSSKRLPWFTNRYVSAACLVLFVSVASVFLYWGISENMNETATYRKVANQNQQEMVGDSADMVLITANGKKIMINNSQELMTVSSQAIQVGNESILKDPTTGQLPEVTYNTLKILRGKRFKMQLSDGTIVWLNADSEITFPNYFKGDNRVVSVKGELFFDVTENKNQPFIVKTDAGNIRVLGTAFNVNCYQGEIPTTTLVKGKIVYSLGDKSTVLTPGQQCRVSNNRLIVEEVDTYDYISWIDEIITFKDKKLEEIMNTLSRLYDVHIVYEDQSLKNLPFTGAFKQYEHLDDIIQMIQDCGLIDIDKQNNEIIIRKQLSQRNH